MRRLGSAALLGGGLPAGVEELLIEVIADGFTLHCCGPKDAPRALVACYEWAHHVDLLTMGDLARVVTARVPTAGVPMDIFAPQVVVWAYEGPAQHAVRALLELVHPAHPDAPTTAYPAPAGLRVPRAQQRPMSIQLPLPGRARVRADRLARCLRCAAVPVVRRDPSYSPVKSKRGPTHTSLDGPVRS